MLMSLVVKGGVPFLQLIAHSAMRPNTKEKGMNVLQTLSDLPSPIFPRYFINKCCDSLFTDQRIQVNKQQLVRASAFCTAGHNI